MSKQANQIDSILFTASSAASVTRAKDFYFATLG
jgi:hypothetical protein